ncbi:type III effector protein XopV, partial [Xanthomonas arboricola pv. pruni str. MAFF 311562]
PLERLPRLRRSKSAAASAAAFPTDSERLDALFGSAQPARGKLLETEQGTVHRTPIQKQEIENLGDGRARVKINPTRLFVSTAPALARQIAVMPPRWLRDSTCAAIRPSAC